MRANSMQCLHVVGFSCPPRRLIITTNTLPPTLDKTQTRNGPCFAPGIFPFLINLVRSFPATQLLKPRSQTSLALFERRFLRFSPNLCRAAKRRRKRRGERKEGRSQRLQTNTTHFWSIIRHALSTPCAPPRLSRMVEIETVSRQRQHVKSSVMVCLKSSFRVLAPSILRYPAAHITL
ncbi:hypothetical protein F4859DRAFT_248027 [Xylaria cf. heliscus]|nr:hypothetical protein F4859DRAFT_248027 [Xylaria cf. heliscus]